MVDRFPPVRNCAFVGAAFVAEDDVGISPKHGDRDCQEGNVGADGHMTVERSFFVQAEEFRRQRAFHVEQVDVGCLCHLVDDRVLAHAQQSLAVARVLQQFDRHNRVFSSADGHERLARHGVWIPFDFGRIARAYREVDAVVGVEFVSEEEFAQSVLVHLGPEGCLLLGEHAAVDLDGLWQTGLEVADASDQVQVEQRALEGGRVHILGNDALGQGDGLGEGDFPVQAVTKADLASLLVKTERFEDEAVVLFHGYGHCTLFRL